MKALLRPKEIELSINFGILGLRVKWDLNPIATSCSNASKIAAEIANNSTDVDNPRLVDRQDALASTRAHCTLSSDRTTF